MAAAVLGRASAAAATAAVAGVTADSPRPRVAVIGAGFAGLAAALTLQRSGRCDVVVLEASSRAGGRACTQPLAGSSTAHALEMGATWFHGLGTPEAPNPVFKHALEQGLIGPNPQGEKWWSSQFLLPGSPQPLSREQQLGLTKALAAWGEAVEGLPEDAQGTTAEHLAAAWDSLLASGQLSSAEQEEAAGRAWRWREHLQRAMDGCDSTWEQSAQGLALYDEMPGGVHCALPAGMQTVAEGLATQLADLRYGHAVQCISWGPSRHSSSRHSGSGSGSGSRHSGVTIACADGTQVQADAAVVTVSLGVLKAQHERLFDPPLPHQKAEAIQRLRIGTVDKVFLDFSPSGAVGEGVDKAVAGGSNGRGQSSDAVEGAGEAVAAAGASAADPPVSYALLWSEPWEKDAAGGSNGDQPAAAAAGEAAGAGTAAALADGRGEAAVPGWARGIFSLRFGGPEVKLLLQHPAQPHSKNSSLKQQEQPQPQRPQQQQPDQQQEQQQQRPQKQQQPHQQQEQLATVSAATLAVEEEEEGTEEAEFNPCAEAAQPSCYQAVAWLTGEAAAAMEAASDEEVLCTLRQLAPLFPQMQLPPGASWAAVQLYRSRWGSNPLTRGSYSYLGPDSSPADVATLAAPLYASTSTADTPGSRSGSSSSNGGKGSDAGGSGGTESGSGTASGSAALPVLLFAGEACHVTYIGTMHGAYMTGQQAAECLVEHWRQQEEALRG